MTKQPGLHLTDLAPKYEDVPVGESFLRVHGISAKAGLDIFARFPKILGMVSGTGFNLGAFLSAAPDAVAAIIATACGQPNDEAAEEVAGGLSVETQWEILEAVGRVTFTKGFAPFVQRIMALAEGAAKSAPSIRVPDMKSPSTSKPSSQPDIPQT